MKSKNEIKDRPSVIAHLSFLQNIMSRMSSNSSSVKALTSVIYTILITIFIAVKRIDYIWWVGILCSLFGAIFDSYYLGLEKTFIKQYNDFLIKINNNETIEKEIFVIKKKTSEYKFERICETIDSIISPSIIFFYGVLIIISILLYNI